MDFLAQLDTAHSYILIGLGAAGAGTGFGGLIWWIIGRSLKKAISHPDDQSVHLRSGVIYVTTENCKKMHEQVDKIADLKTEMIRKELEDHKLILCEHTESISKIHTRINETAQQHHDDCQKILLAVNKKNGS